jgi:peroxidase
MGTSLLTEFRTLDGSGNNLTNFALNAVAGGVETRIAPASFAPDTSNGLVDAPNPREISNVVSGGPDAETSDPNGFSAWMYVWGQFIDHDIDRTPTDGANHIDISIPPGDPDLAGDTIPLTRSVTDPSTGTAVNSITGWIDGSQVYGSDAATAASLRNPDGTLKTSAGDNLPIVNGGFVSGDIRAGENPDLSAVTTLFVREHNFQVARLQQEHTDWTGDQLYQMARAIVTAEIANITYSEFLPKLVGDVIPSYHGYDPSVDPRVTQEFSTAAFRFGHSIVSGEESKIDNRGDHLSGQSLANAFFATPADVAANGGVDALLRNFASDVTQTSDVYAVNELRNLLFAPPAAMDLIAIDIQRERDLGLGSLNQTREALGLTPYTDFNQITNDPAVVVNLQKMFGSVDNVDLFIGGLAEDHAPGALVGDTFQKIIAQQFTSLRDGDRLWWQNQGFDDATVQQIYNTTLGGIEVRNNDTAVIQGDVFTAAERHPSDVAAEDPEAPQLVMGVDDNGAEIAGGPENDTIVAGLGQDQTLTGSGGTDVFMVGDIQPQTVTITDFASDEKLGFMMKASDLNVTAAPDGHAVVQYGNNTINVMEMAPADLSQANFVMPPPVG